MDTGDDTWERGVAAVAALGEPTRRRVYDHVTRQPGPVGRDAVAAALALPRTTVAFHLDHLAKVGLLDVVYQRLTGRVGPGAGRPAKLYHRSRRQVAVSVPERRYELVGRLLAAAIDEADSSGESPRSVLGRRAHELGRQLGEAARAEGDVENAPDPVLRVLAEYGFEPRSEGTSVVLGNCPFHALAQQHTELVCGMNVCLLQGLVDGLAATGLRAHLKPTTAHCCVRLEPA